MFMFPKLNTAATPSRIYDFEYDLDIFMEGSDVNHLKVTKITLHKKDGKARYNWKKVGDYWKMVK